MNVQMEAKLVFLQWGRASFHQKDFICMFIDENYIVLFSGTHTLHGYKTVSTESESDHNHAIDSV